MRKLKPGWIIALVLLALGIGGAVFPFVWPDRAQTALKETRRELRQQGFKIDLAEFDFSASADQIRRASALTNADSVAPTHSGKFYALNTLLSDESLNLMKAAGADTAVVVWRQEKLGAYSGGDPWMEQSLAGQDLWTALREILTVNRAALDAACRAALSGPIRFDLAAQHGSAMLLRHLPAVKKFVRTLGTRCVLELHDGNKDTAWTNLLASTRLVTAWEPEPTEVSHLVRCGCAVMVYNTTWQALQAGGWADERLAQLQREWESVDFFKGRPETVAFARASAVATCQLERREPLEPSLLLKELCQSPRNACYMFLERWRRILYRHHGTFEHERALLLHYRDRELELRRAARAESWVEMRQLPGATNSLPFQSRYPSRTQALLNMRQVTMAAYLYSQGGGGQGPLSQPAIAESRRRLLITAIALERYRGRHGSYPPTLQALVPALLQQVPVDFMDGQPLHYRLMEDSHFVLYSVGLDCVDNGGEMRRLRRSEFPYNGPRDSLLLLQGPDLVWPRPATAAEVQAQQQEKERQTEQAKAAVEEREAELQREAEAARQAAIEKLLAEAAAKRVAPQATSQDSAGEPALQGRPLRELLRNNRTAGTNRLTLDELLTPRQITDGKYEGDAIFEVPVSYDAATNLGRMHLVVDGGMDHFIRGEEGERQTCERAANGNCLLGWTTTYDPPGKHAIQAEFIATKDEQKEETALKVKGPAVPFASTNLCVFSAAHVTFDDSGATLYAKLVEPMGVYVIELTSVNGRHLKTLSGTTSNGVVQVHWDLIDERGIRYTNNALNTSIQVTLPGSGRSQRLQGP